MCRARTALAAAKGHTGETASSPDRLRASQQARRDQRRDEGVRRSAFVSPAVQPVLMAAKATELLSGAAAGHSSPPLLACCPSLGVIDKRTSSRPATPRAAGTPPCAASQHQQQKAEAARTHLTVKDIGNPPRWQRLRQHGGSYSPKTPLVHPALPQCP
jgi:hypothetical protein